MDTEFITDIDATHLSAHELKPHLWVTLHADHLYTYAYRRLNDEEVARDLVQETFLAALEKVSTFKGDSTERTWLTAIIKYKLIDMYRKKARTAKKVQQSAKEDYFFDPDLNNWKREHWPAPFGIEDHDPLNNKEFNKVLQECLQKLPALWMAVFTMKHVDEEVTDVICKELSISSSNFWVIIHRAKVNLRSCLQKNWI